ncbi:MAG: TraR/DksA C4-type zinc finger protein, partial [Candidatus Bathyarchaeia archaeon]
SEKIREKYFNREAMELFEKVVVRREGSREDNERLRKMWSEIGLLMANAPEELFEIEEVDVAEIERAPIFESVRCEICGELAMKTRVRTVNGKTICLSCLGGCEAIVGRGIVPNFKTPFRR